MSSVGVKAKTTHIRRASWSISDANSYR